MPIYQKCSYENERLTDWNSRTEQRERPKRDRLIARVVCNGNIVSILGLNEVFVQLNEVMIIRKIYFIKINL